MEKEKALEEIIRYHDEIVEEGCALTIKDLAINGNDLKNLGIKPGPEMGEILSKLLEHVLEDPSCNTKEALTILVKEMVED